MRNVSLSRRSGVFKSTFSGWRSIWPLLEAIVLPTSVQLSVSVGALFSHEDVLSDSLTLFDIFLLRLPPMPLTTEEGFCGAFFDGCKYESCVPFSKAGGGSVESQLSLSKFSFDGIFFRERFDVVTPFEC